LALALGEAFDITFGRERGNLAFWFAEPEATVKDRFGLTKEILVIYSDLGARISRILYGL
jgi:hypothetical protein